MSDNNETINFKILGRQESGWRCELFGLENAVVLHDITDSKVPNWFWRKMQYLILGNKWVKIK